jgi:hypothetical protein
MPSAKATAVFTGNDSKLQATIKNIGKSLGGMQKKFREGAGNLSSGALSIAGKGLAGLAASGLVAAGAIGYGVKNVLDLGGSLSDMSAKTGIAIDSLMILNQAGKDAGIENLTGAVSKMQKVLIAVAEGGAGPAADALNQLGLSAKDLAKIPANEALDKIGAAIRKIDDPAKKAATSMAIFGKSGAELLPLFADAGALGNAAGVIGGQAAIMAKNAAAFDQASDSLGHIGLKLQGFFVGIAGEIIPRLLIATNALDKIDLSGFGTKFGSAIKTGIDVLTGGFQDPAKLLDVFILYMRAGFLGAVNLLMNGFMMATAVLSKPAFLNAMKDGIIALGTIIDATFKQAFEGPLRFLRDGLETFTGQAFAKMDAINPLSTTPGEIKANQKKIDEMRLQLFGREKVETMAPGIGAVTVPGVAAATDPREIEILKRHIATYEALNSAMTEGRTFAEVQHDNASKSLLTTGETYTAAVARGTEELAKAIEGAAASAAASITKLGTKDYTGATAASAQAAAAAEKLRAKGAIINAAKIAGPAAPGKDIQENTSGYARMVGFRSFDAAAINPLTRGAFGQTPLLSLADRRAKEDARVAAGGMRQASSRMAYGAVRQGDRARRKNVEIERLKKEETIGRSNQLLNQIEISTKKIADDGGLD